MWIIFDIWEEINVKWSNFYNNILFLLGMYLLLFEEWFFVREVGKKDCW